MTWPAAALQNDAVLCNVPSALGTNCAVQLPGPDSSPAIPLPARNGEVSGDAADPAACPLGVAPASVTSVGGVEQQVIVPGF